MTDKTRNMHTGAPGNPGSFAAETYSAPEFSFTKSSTLDAAMERYDHVDDVSRSFHRTSTNRGYEVNRTLVLPATENSPEQRLRGRLKKDSSYAEQCSLKVEVWTSQGWSEVVTAPGHSFADQLHSGYSKTQDSELEDTAHRVLSDHIIDAIRIIS